MERNEQELLNAMGHSLRGAAFGVCNQPGSGFLEEVYQEAMEIELGARQIPFAPKPRLQVFFKEQPLKKHYEADGLVYSAIAVEQKSGRARAPEHEGQLPNEPKAAKKRVGYLINFGAAPRLPWSRRVL